MAGFLLCCLWSFFWFDDRQWQPWAWTSGSVVILHETRWTVLLLGISLTITLNSLYWWSFLTTEPASSWLMTLFFPHYLVQVHLCQCPHDCVGCLGFSWRLQVMSYWIDRWGCLPLSCRIGALYLWPGILRLSRPHTCRANVGISRWQRAWI
jgi:hypothetical protein